MGWDLLAWGVGLPGPVCLYSQALLSCVRPMLLLYWPPELPSLSPQNPGKPLLLWFGSTAKPSLESNGRILILSCHFSNCAVLGKFFNLLEIYLPSCSHEDLFPF